MSSQGSDTIRVNDLIVRVWLGTGAQWRSDETRFTEQPISLTIGILTDVSGAAQADDIKQTIDYAELADRVQNSLASDSQTFDGLEDILAHICPLLVSEVDREVEVKIVQLRAPLHCKTTGIHFKAVISRNGSWTTSKVTHFIDDLTCPTVVGILDVERQEKQDVIANVSIETDEDGLSPENWIDLRHITQILYKEIAVAEFQTLEALTSFVASKTLENLGRPRSVSVRVAKPSALVFARSPEVQITRTLADYPLTPEPEVPAIHRAAIAVGSNLGDSFHNIEYALRLLEVPHGVLETPTEIGLEVTVVNTSFMYETAPMYVTDQPSFINCACMVETTLSPTELLRLLKKIEAIVGRVPSIRNGPRAVDLDVVFYDGIVYDTRADKKASLEGELVVPHPLMQEREFVLRPLADMIPDYVHPVLRKSVSNLLNQVVLPDASPMNKVLPWPRFPLTTSFAHASEMSIPETLTHWTYPSTEGGARKTHLMATLNVTPDSFSDGAKHNVLSAALSYAASSVAAGATIIDIGGYSTRPGAAFVTVEDEISRVVPAVKALRDCTLSPETVQTPISVDTFRWEVAEEAIKAGANCINDVYAFSGPDSWPLPTNHGEELTYITKLKAVARKGDAGKNKDYSQYSYASGSTLEGVRVELGGKIDQTVLGKGGVRRWLVIVDPGIGFSKTLQGNVEVLRNARSIVSDIPIGNPKNEPGLYKNPLAGFPQLIGASRKSFLGAILAEDPHGRQTAPNERIFATATAVSCAVQQGALVVRVHDVQEMADVVKVADSIWSA
ncbi:hypothetical protein D9619_009704 [Psilocybe cf. subviscida]|uniref:2-amino-4-hydroxy-6-hydroxymethyldihydropteridine diphosphokinase n=1 Tax=Psilocybe cf. subviscida TaxID=2480587 RepID=A0A8H5BLH3_9AGAR|nr:hypothetical protein D9619_009704 [Psilocybe cf. subviscida]